MPKPMLLNTDATEGYEIQVFDVKNKKVVSGTTYQGFCREYDTAIMDAAAIGYEDGVTDTLALLMPRPA